ncbi:MAG TPA: OB-fold nucleic acid binding domain-containing protein, partial [Thermomicrobiales bacterium]|nr:OB-fold nucleic acid binding domain-containing protein [Thermomicrobiales bacterium]
RVSGMQVALPLPVVPEDTVKLADAPAWERMAADYAVLGMSPRHHPIDLLRSRLPDDLVTTRGLQSLRNGMPVRIGGLVVCRQRPGTAKGVTFLLIEDELGVANVVVYSKLYEDQRTLVRAEPFILVEGHVQWEDRNLNIIADRFRPLRSVLADEKAGDADESASVVKLITDLSPSSHNYR